MKFEPFKAPSNNHQGFGQGDGAEHTTVKEFVDGVNKYLKALFSGSLGTPAVDPAVGDAATLLAEGLDDAHKRIADLEEGLAEMQRRFDAHLMATPADVAPTPAPEAVEVSANDPDGNPPKGGNPVPEPVSVQVE